MGFFFSIYLNVFYFKYDLILDIEITEKLFTVLVKVNTVY